jgi:hypothetical protein
MKAMLAIADFRSRSQASLTSSAKTVLLEVGQISAG